MKHVTNCCNCGAALNPWKPSCEFCGTKNVNMTALDLASGEPANFIFKMPSNIKVMDKNNNEIYMTVLAVPSLENMCISMDSVEINGGWGGQSLGHYNTGCSLELGLKLETVHRPDNVLYELRAGDSR